MNPYKLRAIVEFIRTHGMLSADDTSADWSVDDVLKCLALDKLLSREELLVVRHELYALAEAEAFMEMLRLEARRPV